jgi:hypothetical protein
MKPIERKFEKFLAGQNKPSQEILYVSLNRNGVIKLNQTCHARLRKAPAVYLYYCRQDDTIAMEPAESTRLPATFTIKPSGTGSLQINAAPFCAHNNIHFDTTRRFITPDLVDGRIYLDLGRTITVEHPRKKRARPPE